MQNSYLPTVYPNWGYNIPGQQMQQSMAGNAQTQGIIWVDGEVGAKAYQLPTGWPANTPIALWDTNDTVIYLKSTNSMGMPNPLQKAHYHLEERPQRIGAHNGEDYTEQSWDDEREEKMAALKKEMQQMREEIDKLKEAQK